jgi:hypothetical protein
MTHEEWWQLPLVPPSPPAPLQELTPLPHGPHPSSSGTSEILPTPPQLTGLDPATTEPEGWAPSHHLALDEPPSPHLTADAPPPSPSSLPTETPPDDADFLNDNVIKGLKILVGVVIIGGAIASYHMSQDD